MAKRYKEKKRKFKHKGMIILLSALIVIIGYTIYYFVDSNKNQQNEVKNNDNIYNSTINEVNNTEKDYTETEINVEEENLKTKLSSNILNPVDLNNEVLEKIKEVENGEIIKIQYKLKSLENGVIELYYRTEKTIYVVEVDIASKTAKNAIEYKEKDLNTRQVITDNLKENINEDFERYKEKINNEGKCLNIIITDTEVVLNTNYN